MTALFVDYYEILEIDPRADTAMIKAAYRTRMLRDHVDLNPDDPRAEQRTILLAEAKQTLLDEQRRYAFDQQRNLWLATRQFRDPGAEVEIDLRDVSIGKLLFGAGVAVVLGGLFVAAQVVADRHNRPRSADRRRRR